MLKNKYESQKKELVKRWERQGINKKVINAFLKVPRENFVMDEWKSQAYDDTPLPILKDQTISQPTTVINMLQSLEIKRGQKILEIGAGSGYNASLLSKLVGTKGEIIAIEYFSELTKFAKQNLERIKIKNVKILKGDGSIGHKKEEPYNRIICTAAGKKIPDLWKKQLKQDGIIIAPVGNKYGQTMIKVTKIGRIYEYEELGEYLFVPLRGKEGLK